MSDLLVRKLDERIVSRLKQRAALHGISVEEEHRRILSETLLGHEEDDQAQSLKRLLLAMPDIGDDEDFERADDLPRTVEFP